MLNKYYGFLLESVLLSTPDFTKVLGSLGDDPIANKLKELLGQDIETKYNYLDTSDEEGKISFIPDDKYKKGIMRSSTALIGRLVGVILRDNNINFTHSQLEDFVYKYKSKIKIQKELDLKVVEGEDLRFWYDEKNHHPTAIGNSSSLANSCMRFERCAKYFDIYVNNPETIKMVIYLEDGLLKARALLWKTNDGWYMDRVYSSERSLENLLLDWVKKEYDLKFSFMESLGKKLEVNIVDAYFFRYPYMDTFKYLNRDSNIIMNYIPLTTNDYIILEDTHGDFSYPETVWSNYAGKYIDESDAVWIEKYSDYYPSSDVVWSKYVGSYIPEVESIWSEYLNTSLPKDESCEVETLSGKNIILPIDDDSVIYVDGEYKHIDMCVWSDYENAYIEEKSSVKVTFCETSKIFNSDLDYVSIPLLRSLKSVGYIKTDQYENYDFISEDLYLQTLYNDSSYEKLISLINKIPSKELKFSFTEEVEKADQMLMFTESYYKINYDKLITEDLMKTSWKKIINQNPRILNFINNSSKKDILTNPYDYLKSDTKPSELLDLSKKISLLLEVNFDEMDKMFYIAVRSMVNLITHGEKYSL